MIQEHMSDNLAPNEVSYHDAGNVLEQWVEQHRLERMTSRAFAPETQVGRLQAFYGDDFARSTAFLKSCSSCPRFVTMILNNLEISACRKIYVSSVDGGAGREHSTPDIEQIRAIAPCPHCLEPPRRNLARRT